MKRGLRVNSSADSLSVCVHFSKVFSTSSLMKLEFLQFEKMKSSTSDSEDSNLSTYFTFYYVLFCHLFPPEKIGSVFQLLLSYKFCVRVLTRNGTCVLITGRYIFKLYEVSFVFKSI